MTDFRPDWVSPPGDTIADLLDEKNWTQRELASRMGVSKKHINDLVRGKATLSPKVAVSLATVLGGDEAFWLEREAQYRAAVAHQDHIKTLSAHGDWLKRFPVAWMANQGWIPKRSKRGEKVYEMLRYFGVASVQAYQQHPFERAAAFRASGVTDDHDGKVAVWLRQAGIQAEAIDTRPFDAHALEEVLPELRSLTTEPDIQVFWPQVQRLCARVGVAVVLVPHPPGCPVYGVTLWPQMDKAVVALSMRYKSDHQLWFSFFHELGHVLLHRGERFIETKHGEDTPQEQEANTFAGELLIPSHRWVSLPALKSEASVRAFAQRIGVAPGIVVGRLQRDGHVPHTHLNGLVQRYEWVAEGDDSAGA